MAKQSNNLIMQDTRGVIGKQVVFKRRGGVTYVAAAPAINPNRKPTPNQLSAQNRFAFSANYAKQAIKDPVMKAMYKLAASTNQSAFNVALKDAYNPPEIMQVITQGYRGQPGDLILIQVVDDFKVVSVELVILGSSGSELERGSATVSRDQTLWTYTVSQQVLLIAGCIIVVYASDLPGNRSEYAVMM